MPEINLGNCVDKKKMEKNVVQNKFIKTLTQTMENYMTAKQEEPSLCKKSNFYEGEGNKIFSNCQHSAMAVYINTTRTERVAMHVVLVPWKSFLKKKM